MLRERLADRWEMRRCEPDRQEKKGEKTQNNYLQKLRVVRMKPDLFIAMLVLYYFFFPIYEYKGYTQTNL